MTEGDSIADPAALPAGDPENGILPSAKLKKGVPFPLNERLKIGQNEATASVAMELGECTAGSVDLVIFVWSGLTRVEAILEGGFVRDGNFRPISSTAFNRAGFARFTFDEVGFPLIRVYYKGVGNQGGVGMVATTVNGSSDQATSRR